jgi:hypothetical protein
LSGLVRPHGQWIWLSQALSIIVGPGRFHGILATWNVYGHCTERKRVLWSNNKLETCGIKQVSLMHTVNPHKKDSSK